jgi:RNase P/RNase MRP subunit p29
VVDETRNTLSLIEGEQTIVLNKTSITFTIGDSDVAIEGAMVNQRPEDRIHRTYRKA